jgi:hypothetical protein
VFDESVFPFASLNPNVGKRFQKEILLLPLDTPSTLGDANIDDYMQLPVVPNVLPVILELVAPDDQVNGANNANASTEEIEIETDGENLANTDARHVVHRDVQVDMHGTGADPDLGMGSDSVASCGSAGASSSPLSSSGRSRSASPMRDATSSTRLFPTPVSLAHHIYTQCQHRSASPPPAPSPPTSDIGGDDSPGGTDRENDDDSVSPSSPVAEVAEPRTRLQKGIRQPKQYTDGTIRYGMFTSIGEPNTLVEALEDTR